MQRWHGVVRLVLLAALFLIPLAPSALAQVDTDGDGIPDDQDLCPTEPSDPEASNTGAPLGCPIIEAPLPDAGGECLIQFTGVATFEQPGGNVKNPAPTPGTYTATGRNEDSTWWLLNGTDWVQGEPVDLAACIALPVAPITPPNAPAPDAGPDCGPATRHRVQRGQTLFSIAQRYGTTVRAISEANEITNPNAIFPGQDLVINCPAPGVVSATATPPAVADSGPSAPAAEAPPEANTLFNLPSTPLNVETASGLSALFSRDLGAAALQIGLFADELDQTVGILTEGGMVLFYSLIAPDVMPGSIIGDNETIYHYAASPGGTLAFSDFSASDGGTIAFVERIQGQPDNSLRLAIPLAQGISVTDIALSDELLATTSGAITGPDAETGVRLWGLVNMRGGQVAFIPHENPVAGIAFSPDGTLLATAGIDGTVQIWQIAGDAPTLLAAVNDGTDSISLNGGGSALAFSPDGALLAVGGADGTLRLWRVAAQQLAAVVPLSAGEVLSVAFSVDGALLAVGGAGDAATQDYGIALLDVIAMTGSGERITLASLPGHTAAVTGLAFNPDGTMLTSVSRDGTWRIWGIAD